MTSTFSLLKNTIPWANQETKALSLTSKLKIQSNLVSNSITSIDLKLLMSGRDQTNF